MSWRRWARTIAGVFLPGLRRGQSVQARARGEVTHVLILDGTMSTLEPGCESNAGLAYKLIMERSGPGLSVYYEAGLQWQDWRSTPGVMLGRGINRQIRRAYGYLASRYRPGDRIILLGYSRGAYAVRSLAGAIDMVGLLRAEHATERNIRTAYRHYERTASDETVAAFRRAYCHEATPIAMVGVWDTVKALGLRLPLLWRLTERHHDFHSTALGASVLRGYHALALDETRSAFEPVLWDSRNAPHAQVTQMWFRGAHGDIGGQLGGFEAARGLSNIPLVWMLEQAEKAGLDLPEGWQARFPWDPDAPSVGTWRGWGKLFVLRKRRVVGADPSEQVHESVAARDRSLAAAVPSH
ncbi:DUF2235 domain-containing protein [Roseovarius sp. ZX-A-9]|uniref:DUF2235 domain-containing protein n=1 Tax=Roseovarius sp. ZX-A-9 TaxID=3014783 RepID=UPI00232E7DB9|nr:DUF2235 domain-containing protein [Roseovarius sp. ZX-A-9]